MSRSGQIDHLDLGGRITNSPWRFIFRSLVLLIIITILILVVESIDAVGGEEDRTQSRTREETGPTFYAHLSKSRPFHFYPDQQDHLNITIHFRNFGPGNITVNVSWEEMKGFNIAPEGNTTFNISSPLNQTYHIGMAKLNFTLTENFADPLIAPNVTNINFTTTMIKWEAETPPDVIEQLTTVEVHYEELNASYQIGNVFTDHVIGEWLQSPQLYNWKHISFFNTGNADLQFEYQIIPENQTHPMFTYSLNQYQEPIELVRVHDTNRHSFTFYLDFTVEQLPSFVNFTVNITTSIVSDIPELNNQLLGINSYNITYEFIHFSEVRITEIDDRGFKIDPGERKEIIVTFENRGNWEEFFTLEIHGNNNESNRSFEVLSYSAGIWLGPQETGSLSAVIQVDSHPDYGYTMIFYTAIIRGEFGSNHSRVSSIVIHREEPFNPVDELGEELDSELPGYGYGIGYSICFGVPALITFLAIKKWSKLHSKKVR